MSLSRRNLVFLWRYKMENSSLKMEFHEKAAKTWEKRAETCMPIAKKYAEHMQKKHEAEANRYAAIINGKK